MTAMSSRRGFESIGTSERSTSNGTAWIVAAFVIGLVLLVSGIYTNIAFLAVIGFVPFVSSLLYWNAMFWAKVMGDKWSSSSFRHYHD